VGIGRHCRYAKEHETGPLVPFGVVMPMRARLPERPAGTFGVITSSFRRPGCPNPPMDEQVSTGP